MLHTESTKHITVEEPSAKSGSGIESAAIMESAWLRGKYMTASGAIPHRAADPRGVPENWRGPPGRRGTAGGRRPAGRRSTLSIRALPGRPRPTLAPTLTSTPAPTLATATLEEGRAAAYEQPRAHVRDTLGWG